MLSATPLPAKKLSSIERILATSSREDNREFLVEEWTPSPSPQGENSPSHSPHESSWGSFSSHPYFYMEN
jgi:hypothetical protein